MSEQPTQTDRRAERRCGACGALVSADAEWCGQCLEPLRSHEPEPASAPKPVQVTAPDRPAEGATAVWPCAACDHRNPIDRAACEMCGTSFAAVMRSGEANEIRIAADVALRWSLAYPGLGHVKMGRAAEGVARGVLFTWTLAGSVGLLLAAGGLGGPLMPLFGLFSIATVMLYAIAAVDARRVALGDRELVTSRMLLWGVVGLVVLSAALGVIPIVGALGR